MGSARRAAISCSSSTGLQGNEFGARSKAATGHQLGVAHQPVEVNFRRRNKSAGTTSALHHTFAFELGERVAGGHQTNAVNASQLTLGADFVSGLELSTLNPFQDDSLDPLVRGYSILASAQHGLDLC